VLYLVGNRSHVNELASNRLNTGNNYTNEELCQDTRETHTVKKMNESIDGVASYELHSISKIPNQKYNIQSNGCKKKASSGLYISMVILLMQYQMQHDNSRLWDILTVIASPPASICTTHTNTIMFIIKLYIHLIYYTTPVSRYYNIIHVEIFP
jgi:hypothetical protein